MNFKLDKWDAEFIHAAKHARGGSEGVKAFIEKAYSIWRERCLLPADYTDWRLAEAMVTRFLPMITAIRSNALREIMENSNPNAFRWTGASYVPAYWDMFLFNVGMQFAVTLVVDLPGYVELLEELEIA